MEAHGEGTLSELEDTAGVPCGGVGGAIIDIRLSV